MVTSDRLLRLVQELQRDVTVRQGRHTLLNYARSSTGAHLALLFVFDKVEQRLILLERIGRRLPQQSSLSRNQQASSREQSRRISSLGLFGSVLQQRGLLCISSASAYSRSLEEERYWIGQDERI